MHLCFIFLSVLFAVQSIQADTQKSIGIFAYVSKEMPPWDPDTIKSGIVGSEESVIYISKELANMGYKVVVFGNPPSGSPHSQKNSNPRFVNAHFDDGAKFDIAIAWRLPQIAEKLKLRADSVYFWPHDTYHWPLTNDQINGFTDTLWISEWQRRQWISVNPPFAKFTTIFGNGIIPEQFKPVQARSNPYSCIYGSNYARGLAIMLDIWPEVKKQFPKATLDVYYGWQHWGLLSYEQEAKMRLQMVLLAGLDVTDHGLVGHEELNEAYGRASFWTYPCIAPETFCITAIRAQLSGAVPVIIEGTALKETVRHGYKCQKPEEYLTTLTKAMQEAEKITLEERQKMGSFVLKEYTWRVIAERWSRLFESVTAKSV